MGLEAYFVDDRRSREPKLEKNDLTLLATGTEPRRGCSAATLRQRPAAIAQVRALPAASEIQRPRVLGSGVEVDRGVVPAQVTAELIDPEEQVGIGGVPRGVELRQRRSAYRIHAGAIDRVVPVRGHFLGGRQLAAPAGEVVAVGLDDLAQLRVSVQQR